MCQVSFDIPNEVLEQMDMREEEMVTYARKVVALHLFKDNVELGYCAETAGMNADNFMRFMGEYGDFVFR